MLHMAEAGILLPDAPLERSSFMQYMCYMCQSSSVSALQAELQQLCVDAGIQHNSRTTKQQLATELLTLERSTGAPRNAQPAPQADQSAAGFRNVNQNAATEVGSNEPLCCTQYQSVLSSAWYVLCTQARCTTLAVSLKCPPVCHWLQLWQCIKHCVQAVPQRVICVARLDVKKEKDR